MPNHTIRNLNVKVAKMPLEWYKFDTEICACVFIGIHIHSDLHTYSETVFFT